MSKKDADDQIRTAHRAQPPVEGMALIWMRNAVRRDAQRSGREGRTPNSFLPPMRSVSVQGTPTTGMAKCSAANLGSSILMAPRSAQVNNASAISSRAGLRHAAHDIS
jgi:hypothetical protein